MEKKIIESNQNGLFSRGIIAAVIVFTIIMANCIYGLYESHLKLDAAEAKYEADKYNWELWGGSYKNVSNDERSIKKYESEIVKFTVFVVVMTPLVIILIFVFIYSIKSSIVITDKRVYGIAIFGRRVDIPIESISSVENGMMGSVNIISFSKKTSFIALENSNDVCKAVWDLLSNKNKQSDYQSVEAVQEEKTDLDIDVLRKYKSLLDDGIMSQEEYETKKQQILKL